MSKTARTRLSAIEEFFFADDRAAHPCSCKVRADFSGDLDLGAMEAALRDTLQRYPRFCSVVSGVPPVWLPPQNDAAIAILNSDFPQNSLDLANGRGLAVRTSPTATGSALEFLFHHACSDGLGFCDFLSDLLVAYAGGCGIQPVGKPRQRTEFLSRQHPASRRLAAGLWALLLEWRTFINVPAPLVPHPAAAVDHEGGDSRREVSHWFSETESAELRRAAQMSGVGYNDLLIRDALLAVAEWRKPFAEANRDPLFRVVIPSGRRSAPRAVDSQTNAVSLVFLDRRESSICASRPFLVGLSREILRKRRRGSDEAFLLLIGLARLLPGGIRKHVQASKCLASVVVSNLGCVLRNCPLPRNLGRIVAGSATLESLSAYGPLRPFQPVGFWVIDYASRLSVTLGYDSRAVSNDDANEILAAFLRRSRESCGQGAPASRQR